MTSSHSEGPLFMTLGTRNVIAAAPRMWKAPPVRGPEVAAWLAGSDAVDGRGIDRAMLAVQQQLMDVIFNGGVQWSACSRRTVEGRGWKTAEFFPGMPSTADEAPGGSRAPVYTSTINAAAPAMWGRPVLFQSAKAHVMPLRRPTGFYLNPGEFATVTVPQSLVDTRTARPFKVLVGAHDTDNGGMTIHSPEKNRNRRLDRITATFDIAAASTLVTNPLGGGIYILVPDGADLGMVQIQISGGVVVAPFFRKTASVTTTADEWERAPTTTAIPGTGTNSTSTVVAGVGPPDPAQCRVGSDHTDHDCCAALAFETPSCAAGFVYEAGAPGCGRPGLIASCPTCVGTVCKLAPTTTAAATTITTTTAAATNPGETTAAPTPVSAAHSRTSAAPWADFETDHFLMQVPSAWISDKTTDEILKLLDEYERTMAATSTMYGHPIETFKRHVLYVQPDLHIKHNTFGVGYPQINTNVHVAWSPGGKPQFLTECGPADVMACGKQHWLVTNPVGQAVSYHELGHSQLNSMYPGEGEAIVNFLHVYIRNTEFGVDLDTAFEESISPENRMSMDKAAMHWMVTENFRAGNDMKKLNYRHRGFGKYAAPKTRIMKTGSTLRSMPARLGWTRSTPAR